MGKARIIKIFVLLCLAVSGFVFYKNRYTETEEAYTFTHCIYKNDVIEIVDTEIMNEYNDKIQNIHELHYNDGFVYTSTSYSYYRYKYDKNGNKLLSVSTDNFGNISTKKKYKYDKHGNCIYEHSKYSDGYFIGKSEYNENNQKIRYKVDTEDLKYSNHNIYEYFYDENDRLIKETDSYGAESVYEYNENGLLESLTKRDLWTEKEKYEYNNEGLMTHKYVYLDLSDSPYEKVEYDYNEKSELISETKTIYRENDDVDVYKTRYSYDSNGNKTSELYTSNGIRNKYTTYVYDDDSRLIAQNEYQYYYH